MNLDIFRPEREIHDLFLSTSRKCERFLEETQTKSEQTLDFKITRQKETFSNKQSKSLGSDSRLIIGFTSSDRLSEEDNLTERVVKTTIQKFLRKVYWINTKMQLNEKTTFLVKY